MTDDTQPEALRLAEILEGDYCPDWFYEQGVDEVSAELRAQHARITELEAQLESIGAGGVSGPLMGIAAPHTAQAEGWTAEQALRNVLAAVQRHMPPDGPDAKDTLSEIIAIVDPWPLGPLEKS
jgi:hypothetical protein